MSERYSARRDFHTGLDPIAMIRSDGRLFSVAPFDHEGEQMFYVLADTYDPTAHVEALQQAVDTEAYHEAFPGETPDTGPVEPFGGHRDGQVFSIRQPHSGFGWTDMGEYVERDYPEPPDAA